MKHKTTKGLRFLKQHKLTRHDIVKNSDIVTCRVYDLSAFGGHRKCNFSRAQEILGVLSGLTGKPVELSDVFSSQDVT